MVGKFLINAGLLACLAMAALAQAAPAADVAAAKPQRPRLDVAFCIDTTGSMQGELDVVKNKMKELVAKLSSTKPVPNIRVGLVAYRDRGDEYVTRVFQFTEDIDKIVKDIADLRADGGGDGPEAVNQALHCAVSDLRWDENRKTTKVLFLIGDAGPNIYHGDYNWKNECAKAIARGIQINTIACDGLEGYPVGQGTDVFREIARLTDGRFETLAYRQEVVTADGRRETLISSGGALYRVKGSLRDEWKAGAAALLARGGAEKTTVRPASKARAVFGMPMRSAAAPLAASIMAAPAGIAAEAAFADAAPAARRSDSNLDEVLLSGAKAAMEKTARGR